MRDAAVGFQCPECIAEGRRTVRAPRTRFGGLAAGLASGRAGITSLVLIGINVAVWLAITATGGGRSRLLPWLELLPRGRCAPGAQSGVFYPRVHSDAVCSAVSGHWVPGVADGAYWQLVTSAFTHVALMHIAFNMLALYVLGPQLELAVGRARFLAIYLISALTGSAAVYWLAPAYQSTVGASGAIFGLMGALLVVALTVRADVQGILVWIGINFLLTVSVSGISWQGHLGGFIGGTLVAAVLALAPRGPRRTAYQVGGTAAVAALAVGAIVLRTAALA
jgi:membrane associated rhomboid family serine protease